MRGDEINRLVLCHTCYTKELNIHYQETRIPLRVPDIKFDILIKVLGFRTDSSKYKIAIRIT